MVCLKGYDFDILPLVFQNVQKSRRDANYLSCGPFFSQHLAQQPWGPCCQPALAKVRFPLDGTFAPKPKGWHSNWTKDSYQIRQLARDDFAMPIQTSLNQKQESWKQNHATRITSIPNAMERALPLWAWRWVTPLSQWHARQGTGYMGFAHCPKRNTDSNQWPQKYRHGQWMMQPPCWQRKGFPNMLRCGSPQEQPNDPESVLNVDDVMYVQSTSIKYIVSCLCAYICIYAM